ncbi:MAG: ABC transporter substrate-binding protein [Myxococcota bacterium]|nr:ABC transporter substrate-binding protein [Myxococcota bacterium]
MTTRYLALLALLAGCDGSETPATSGDADVFPRDTLVIAFQSDAESLLDVVSQSAADGEIIQNLNYPIIDADFDCEMKPRPALAKSWEWNEDGTILSMELRDDISWSDGTKVTASDIAFTMELVADSKVASPRIAYIENMKADGRPKVIDETHIEWHFTHAYDRITQASHAAVLHTAPRHILEGADRATLRGHAFNTKPTINGRWKLAKWDRGERIVLEPNENWTGPADEMPKLERVIFRVLPEYATRLIELETGGVDLMQGILVSDADRLAKEHPEIKLHRRGWRSIDYVAWNQVDSADFKAMAAAVPEGERIDLDAVKRHHIFGDREVRRALAKAVNVDKLIDDLLKSETTGEVYGKPAVGTITPALCNVHNDDIERIGFDPSAARSELEGLGWTDSDGNGILDKDGRELSFSLMTNSGNKRRANASIIIQATLKQAGVHVELETVESNTFFERLRKKDYEAALSGWSAGLFVDPTVIWHSGPEYEFNFVSYKNERVDELIEAGLREPDPEKSAPLWQEMQQLIYDDQPYAFLYWMDEIVGVNERFEDPKIDVQGAFRDLHSWWVPADKVKYRH